MVRPKDKKASAPRLSTREAFHFYGKKANYYLLLDTESGKADRYTVLMVFRIGYVAKIIGRELDKKTARQIIANREAFEPWPEYMQKGSPY